MRVVMKNLRGGRRVEGKFCTRKCKPKGAQGSRRQKAKGRKRHRCLQAKLVISRPPCGGCQARVLHKMFADNQKMVRDCIFAIHFLGLAVFRALKLAAAFSFTGLLGNGNSGISGSTAALERDMATA